jgi:AAA+ superfamily predicted ATPase
MFQFAFYEHNRTFMKKNKLFRNIALWAMIGGSMVHIQLFPMKYFQAAKGSAQTGVKETVKESTKTVVGGVGEILERADVSIGKLEGALGALSNIQVAPVTVDMTNINETIADVKKSLADVITPENALKLGAGLAIAGATYHGGRKAWNFLENKLLTKSEIIDNEAYPKYGRIDRLRRWWAGYKTPQLIFNPEVKARLQAIKEKIKNIRDRIFNGDVQTTYTNLLLYGPPGTGKTTFARALADYTDMDFLPVSGSRLLQSELLFNEVIDLANRSTYGAIIFIDEADSLFMDRQLLMASNAPNALSQYNALNHILGVTGQKNNKYMIIAATNNPHVLDEAMNRRFPDAVEMPLPTLPTRVELLNLYINKQLFDEKNNTKQFVAAARSLLTSSVIQEIAQKTEGFSHSTIENLVTAIRNSIPKSGIITQNIIDTAINEALIQSKDFAKSKEKRANLFKK